ncbi:MAG: hypothetical protein ACXABD_01260 [Candidatus Thorarchaeota archaeon]|jgi:hypothetical protein
MTDNSPFDTVSMYISVDFTNAGFDKMYDTIEALGLGQIAYLDKNIVYHTGTTERMCDSYTVYFRKWTPYGIGAQVRQGLQDGQQVKIYDNKNQYLWTVTCPLCKRRRELEKARQKPIRFKTPEWKSARGGILRKTAA